jgi:hypothetical protein
MGLPTVFDKTSDDGLTVDQKIRAIAITAATNQRYPGNLGSIERAEIFAQYIATGELPSGEADGQ